MVGCDHDHTAHLVDGSLYQIAHAGVNRFHGCLGGVEDACVTDHVAVGEVDNDDVVLAGEHAFNQSVAHFIGAHFRLEIVCRNGGRLDKHSVLALVLLFYASVEEEGDMGVLLGFCNAELCLSERGNVFAECIFQ